ncbi:hypothetical protein DFW101_0312 [Solidesulfovibrio carbinoliphilus subsp. oakridgensis]|uniref:Uncharacterized protein n=1 Tax=Solidesulfovibrio carbinoliphilus subsp. oakridgensis TaxID=694327 RepID=G7QD23_9BACT|nr:hypothetical protein [Solidesulfovibrio carbinoliphilus]EHJ46329.1 hypothetical protein DFW101_0312 [Solidesulfovibrio carbinoliphilus subsp. oakridgensis]
MIIYDKLTKAAQEWPNKAPVPTTHTTIAPPVTDQPVTWLDGGWHVGEVPAVEPTPEEVAAALAQAKTVKLAEIRAACDTALAPLAAAYPEREVQSWPQQIAEANAYAADAAAAVTLLRTMAAERPSLGETDEARVAELARRILANAAAWSTIAGPIIGKRQALEDAVVAADTPEAVADITIDLGGAA